MKFGLMHPARKYMALGAALISLGIWRLAINHPVEGLALSGLGLAMTGLGVMFLLVSRKTTRTEKTC